MKAKLSHFSSMIAPCITDKCNICKKLAIILHKKKKGLDYHQWAYILGLRKQCSIFFFEGIDLSQHVLHHSSSFNQYRGLAVVLIR